MLHEVPRLKWIPCEVLANCHESHYVRILDMYCMSSLHWLLFFFADKSLTSVSSLQPMSTAIINILDKAGSNGNSTICRPKGFRLPVLSSAPRIHNWYIEFKMLSYSSNKKNDYHGPKLNTIETTLDVEKSRRTTLRQVGKSAGVFCKKYRQEKKTVLKRI